MKNKYVAAWLALVFGWLWFHKFYLWKWIQWILYILFMPITVFIAILEWVVYLINSQEWFDVNFNMDYIKNQDYIKSKK